jgi:hypothetical protein
MIYRNPCYSNLLLRRRRRTGIFWWRILGYVLPRLSFLWSYVVFCYSVSLRVIIVFRDITYVIITLYSWHLIICEHFWPYVLNNWSWILHTMSTWFWHKTQVWHILKGILYQIWPEDDVHDVSSVIFVLRAIISLSTVSNLSVLPNTRIVYFQVLSVKRP